MIRSHRRAHRVVSLVLLAVLPALVVFGLVTRKPPPTLAELPPQLRAQVVAPQMTLRFASDSWWPDLPITSYLFADSGSYLLFLFLEQVIPYPDVLVYWSESPPADLGPPDANAVLLGALSAVSVARFDLAPQLVESGGTLFLYSLGHQRQIGSVAFPLSAEPREDSGP